MAGRAGRDRRSGRPLGSVGCDPPGSFCGGQKCGAAADGAEGDLHGLRPADDLEHGALRCAVGGRDGFASRADRGDGDGRRQDVGRDPAAVFECFKRGRRPSRDGERLPGATRCGVDGPALQFSRADLRHHPTRSAAGFAARAVCLRHHLRDELRVRLRLSARQRNGHDARAAGAARLQLCDRG